MQAGRPAEISVDHGLQNHALAVVAPRSSLPMGSSTSKPAEPSVAAKVRRAFAGRRKKEKDIDLRSLSGSVAIARPVHQLEVTQSSASSPPQVPSPASPPVSRPKHQLSQLSSVFSVPKRAPTPDAPRPLPLPPPPPPKPASEPVPAAPVPVTQRAHPAPLPAAPAPNRTSIMPVSPGMESALTYIALTDQLQQQQAAPLPSLPSPPANTYPSPGQPTPSTSDGHPLPENPSIQGSSKAQEPECTPLQADVEEPRRIERPRARSESEGVFLERDYADKRKSDSTISHCTIRGGGPRSSRPVSMAESFQSTYTIVPGNGGTSVGVVMVNKRLSTVDVDLSLLEEDDDSSRSFHDLEDQRGSVVIVRPEEKMSNPLLQQKRRSMSLNVGIAGNNSQPKLQVQYPPPSASAAELKQPSYSISEGFYNHPASTSSSLAASHSSQLQTWTPNRLPPNRNQKLPALPPTVNPSFTYPIQRPLPNHPPPPASFRQTAVSISSSFAPAAGLARKAVEKVKGALGHMGHHSSSTSGSISLTSMSSASGYSSSASINSTALSSYPNEWGVLNLTRTPSNQSSVVTHTTHSSSMHAVNIKEIKERTERERQQQAASAKKKDKRMRRTPNGASGTYSIGSVSTTSASDSDAFMSSTGPTLGILLRGPVRNRNGAFAASGIVFGRELARCVRDTAIWTEKEDMGTKQESDGRELMGGPELKIYERRMLPAVVARCAQHILIWGVQEEGLFRVPGRAAHISKLKSEFDTGVDYDMSGCTPGDLDPHAVASIFKAYLRELPEHILTQKLSPYFDVAIEQESSTTSADSNNSHFGMRKGMGLPSSQKPTAQHNASGSMSSMAPSMSSTISGFAFPAPNLRKPPSLSTFAMPSFSGARPASANLVSALRSLITKLPRENRDLLRTVVELVKATDKESKMTKMPLSNLLMVFLPSLNISAQLLKVLCEDERVWSGLVDTGIAEPQPVEAESEVEDAALDEDEVLDVRRDTVVLDIRRDGDDQQTPKVDGEGAVKEAQEGDEDEDEIDAHRRWTAVHRPEIPTVYLDSRSQASSASLASSALPDSSREASTTDSSMLQDDLSSVSASTGSMRGDDTGILSSSVESVLTPLTSSVHSSAVHLPLDALDTVKDLSGRGWDAAQIPAVRPAIQVVEPAPLGLEIGVEREEGQVRRLAISNPLPYTSASTPPPVTTATATFEKSTSKSPISPKRCSIPTLSFPSLPFGHRNSHDSVGSEPVSPAESLSSRKSQSAGGVMLRTKKPSLKLLFSKKSAGSLNSGPKDVIAANTPSSAPGSAPGSAGSHSFRLQQLRTTSMGLTSHGSISGCDGSGSSDSSVSTPLSAVTAPGTGMGSGPSSSVTDLPPLLDASFEEGPSLRKELGLEESPPGTATSAEQQQREKVKKERVKTMVGQTPIADWYSTKSAASSVADLRFTGSSKHVIDERGFDDDDEEYGYDVEARRRTVMGRQRGASASSQVSLNHLGLDDNELGAEEDWTRSVLLAADVELGLGRRT
ncbi:Rho GTPase-activating protein gacZ [Leucoagaricus sp. SymC.cos]|nr:Rho GTPase-activating protein gacZ [Leucoagaricus sp. SymC.cos]